MRNYQLKPEKLFQINELVERAKHSTVMRRMRKHVEFSNVTFRLMLDGEPVSDEVARKLCQVLNLQFEEYAQPTDETASPSVGNTDFMHTGWSVELSRLSRFSDSPAIYVRAEDIDWVGNQVWLDVGRSNSSRRNLSDEAAIAVAEKQSGFSLRTFQDLLHDIHAAQPFSILHVWIRSGGGYYRIGATGAIGITGEAANLLELGRLGIDEIRGNYLQCPSNYILLLIMNDYPQASKKAGFGGKIRRGNAYLQQILFQVAHILPKGNHHNLVLYAFNGTPENETRASNFKFVRSGGIIPKSELRLMKFARSDSPLSVSSIISNLIYQTFGDLLHLFRYVLDTSGGFKLPS